MINLESIEIIDNSSNGDNDNNDNDYLTQTSKKKQVLNNKQKKSGKKNIFETETEFESDIITQSDTKSNSDKINIDEINIGYPKASDPNIQSKIYAKREIYESFIIINYQNVQTYQITMKLLNLEKNNVCYQVNY